MKVIFNKTTVYENVTRAVRSGENATLYIAQEDGAETKAEFIGCHDFSVFVLEEGEWSSPDPTREDKIEAQATYTAMMTDTLIEEG